MRFCISKYGALIFAIFVALFAGCSSTYDASVDCYSTSQLRKYSLPSFTTYIMNVKGENGSRGDIYIQTPYKNLRFEKVKEGYKASFSLTFIIRNTQKEIVQTKELERTVSAKTYEESVSSRFDAVLQSFVLKPSEYIVEIVSNDHLSQLLYKQITRFVAKEFADTIVSSSTLLLLDTITNDGKGVLLRPIFPYALSTLSSSFGIFQELYNVQENDSVKIEETFYRSKKYETDESPIMYYNPPYRVKSDGCNEAFDSLYYKNDSSFVIKKNGAQQIIQFIPLPSTGYTKVERQIIVTRKSKKDTIKFSEKYFLRDRKMIHSLSSEEVIESMRYILRDEEYDSLVNVKGQERNKRINQFWESRGGVDRRKEFEQRILEANTLFTSCANGAETPMGIVFIICGMPDYIECQSGITETWYYNFGERSYAVPFRREKENIVYYTLQAFSVNDLFWQYYVDRWRRKK